jgi:hypothetical protein
MKVIIRTVVVSFLLSIGFSSNAKAGRTCFCDAVMAGININDSVHALTSVANLSFPGALGGLSAADRGDCSKRCHAVFGDRLGDIAKSACAQNRANNSFIYPAYWIGTDSKIRAGRGAKLTNKPAGPITEKKCTAPWMSNTSNIPGGVTTDGRCKKEFMIQNFTISPKPLDGTQIGNWGFYWGNAVVAYGTPQNGGAAVSQQTGWSQAICKLTPL